MNFASAVEALRRNGARCRRQEWPLERYVTVSRGSATMASGAIVDYGKARARTRWRPLLRDVSANDWEIVAP